MLRICGVGKGVFFFLGGGGGGRQGEGKKAGDRYYEKGWVSGPLDSVPPSCIILLIVSE